MRKDFFDYLLKLMRENEKIYILFVGLGYPRYKEFKKKFPQRTINTEASEQTALDIAVGLSMSGMIPIVYTITPFYWRAAETIRQYITHENLPVIMCGAGRDDDYSKEDGFSHDAKDISKLMDALDITGFWPNNKQEMRMFMRQLLKNPIPSFLSLIR
jgi:transketolase C-terminal domain/subunit